MTTLQNQHDFWEIEIHEYEQFDRKRAEVAGVGRQKLKPIIRLANVWAFRCMNFPLSFFYLRNKKEFQTRSVM